MTTAKRILLTLALLAVGVAEAQPTATCSAGSNCKVLSLTATKVTGAAVLLAGDAGVRFGDGSLQNTAAVSAAAPSMAAFGSTPNANGGSFSSSVLTLQPADSTNPGGVTSGTQTIGGNKTFAGSVTASSDQIMSGDFRGRSSGAITTFRGDKSDTATAIGVAFDNNSALTTVGSQLFSWRNGGTEFAYTQPNGVSSAWMQHPVTGAGKRTGTYTISTTADVAFTALGLPAPTILTAGTVAAAPTADGTLMMIDYPTTSVSSNASGIAGPYASTRFDFRPRFTAVVRTGASIASTRILLGLAASDVSGVATLGGLDTIKSVLVRYDTGISDTQWMIVTSDGSTASSAVCSSTAVAISTTYIIDLDFTRSGGVVCRINNGAIGSVNIAVKTTNVPSGTTDVGIQASATTLAAAAKDFYIGKVALEQN